MVLPHKIEIKPDPAKVWVCLRHVLPNFGVKIVGGVVDKLDSFCLIAIQISYVGAPCGKPLT